LLEQLRLAERRARRLLQHPQEQPGGLAVRLEADEPLGKAVLRGDLVAFRAVGASTLERHRLDRSEGCHVTHESWRSDGLGELRRQVLVIRRAALDGGDVPAQRPLRRAHRRVR
jgi:hypothetical protein